MPLSIEPNIITTIVTGTLLFGLLTVFIIYFILLYRKSQTKLHYERERKKQELLQAEIEIKEQTLVNVSREIHDNLGQAAALVKINLNLISKEIPKADQEKINESSILMKQLIADMRSLSQSLNGDNIKRKGIISMLAIDAKRINKTGYVQVDFQHPKSPLDLHFDQQTILYRILQELFTNTLKYAKAEKVDLKMEENANQITVNYADNGIGFDYEKALFKGSGLSNIKDRCTMIDAKLYFQSEINKGTKVHITLQKPQVT
ncbi:MAG: sensor histidine kinase [Crocinitomicaceae bacterium]